MPPNSFLGSDARTLSWFRAARWLGALLLALSLMMLAILPRTAGSLPPGLRTPILAFEFAASRAEVEALFAEPGSALRAELVDRMDRGNTLDYAYMLSYASFLAVVAVALARTRGSGYLVAAVLAPLAAAADVLENEQLFAITRSLGGHYDDALARLGLWTRVKWGGLTLALAWLAPALWRGSRTERVAGALCVATLLLAAASAIDRARFAETFALFLSLAFIGLWIAALQRAAAG